MKKIIFCEMLTLFLLSCFPVVIEADSYNNDGVNEFQQAYKIGRDKGILNDYNMSYEEFRSLCKNSVFPAYLQAKKEGDTLSFQQYVAADNYEIPKDLMIKLPQYQQETKAIPKLH